MSDYAIISLRTNNVTFTVYFPQTRAPKTLTEPKDNGKEVPSGQETILLVEDEDPLRNLATRILSKRGYTVLSAADGQAGLDLLMERDGNVDLILTDLVMPNIGGKEFAHKSLNLYPDLKILFMTGYERHPDDSLPDVPVLEKPFQMNELLRQVRKRLDT